MEKFNLLCGVFPPVIYLSEVFRNWQQKVYLFLAAVLLLMVISMPASAAVEGFLAKDSDGSYHQYCYKELVESYAASLMGKPDGLFEDFAKKEPVALLDCVGGYVDYSYLIEQYAKSLVKGETFVLTDYTESENARKVEIPAQVKLVSSAYGQLVRLEKNFQEEGSGNSIAVSAGGSDKESTAGAETEERNPKPENPEKENARQYNPIEGSSKVKLTEAQSWAKSKNAHQRFIDIAPLYWEYGKKTGIRPEVLYAQAAYETGYGRYNGQVPAEFNNWAGIKVGGSNGDQPEDHQKFATPEDGVRGHFNHMSAYLGLQPIGEPHDRYYSVKSIGWAGTVEYVEELSGTWAPSSTYHEIIIRMIGEMK